MAFMVGGDDTVYLLQLQAVKPITDTFGEAY